VNQNLQECGAVRFRHKKFRKYGKESDAVRRREVIGTATKQPKDISPLKENPLRLSKKVRPFEEIAQFRATQTARRCLPRADI